MQPIREIPQLPQVPFSPSHSSHFSKIQHSIDRQHFADATTMLLSLFTVVFSEDEIICCYKFLFQLFPHFTSIGLLENNLPHLLSRSSFLPEYQQRVALELGAWYRNQQKLQDAMHAFGKALQIKNDKETHRLASRLFVDILHQRLEKFLTNATPSLETLCKSLEEIQTFKLFCFQPEDLHPFYTKALSRINNIPFDRQESYVSCREEILQKQLEPFTLTSFATERYWHALQMLRNSFFFPLADARAFQSHTANAFKEMFNVFIEDAFILLGEAPCGYDIRAMGSLGREEICPYSDLEFLILIEDDQYRLYFKRLVEILEIQIASLGETQRFPFFFTCLAHQNPSGLHIDNSPTQEERLIGTPINMAALQEDSILGPQEIACTSTKTISLSQNSGHLYLEFRNQLKEELLQKRAVAKLVG